MSDVQDKTNCIKNLIQIMCCDGQSEDHEKKFLAAAARHLEVDVKDWNALKKEVTQDPQVLYPVQNRDRAVASLKAMIVMAKADRHVDKKEGDLILQFAKSLGMSNQEWKKLLKDIDLQTLFDPFESASVTPSVHGNIMVLKEDFDKLDQLLNVIKEYNIPFQTAGCDDFFRHPVSPENTVFFHAAEQREKTVDKCQRLLEKSGDRVVSVLTRYQGYQVRYLLEIGLKKCIIEPVYARDLQKVFAAK